MANVEQGRNERWQEWYPTVRPDLHISLERSPYGQPNNETLALFESLPVGSSIGDIGGGEGRYALPLSRMGHKVLVTDVDFPHLARANEKKTLPGVRGDIFSIQSDATSELAIQDNSLDAALNAGFGYLIPPDGLADLFDKMVKAVKPNGLIVFEFATNRDRRPNKDSIDSLIGPKEYNYSKKKGLNVLGELFNKHGLEDRVHKEKTIHLEEPYYLHNDLLIVAGRKPKN